MTKNGSGLNFWWSGTPECSGVHKIKRLQVSYLVSQHCHVAKYTKCTEYKLVSLLTDTNNNSNTNTNS